MEQFEVIPEKIVFGGDGLAKLNGKNIFIPYSIPGEKVQIEITKNTKDFDLAKITKIVEPSPFRVEPFCPFYQKCGGCNLQHIQIEKQKEIRSSILKETFERQGINVPEIEIISGNEKNYRCRVQLTDGGFSQKKSNEIIELDHCPVATEEINDYLSKVEQSSRPKSRVHVFGDKRVFSQSVGPFSHLKIAEESKTLSWETKTIGKSKKTPSNKVKQRFAGTLANENNNCTVTLCGKKIQFDVKGFFQSNLEVLEKTIKVLTKNFYGKNVIDMYAGSGTFSVFLADSFENIILVEHNRDALVNAEINLQGAKHETYGVSGAKWVKENAPFIQKNYGFIDAVVIDPPRSGMEKEVNSWLCNNKVGQIRSVSCDPATHARDAKLLLDSGYTLTKLYLLDFYPQTSHIESLAFFEYTE